MNSGVIFICLFLRNVLLQAKKNYTYVIVTLVLNVKMTYVRTVHDFLREYQIEVEIAQKKAATDKYKI